MKKQGLCFLSYLMVSAMSGLRPVFLFFQFISFFMILTGFLQTGFCLEPLSESQARGVVGASGFSMAADDVLLYMGSDTLRFESRNNRNLFDRVRTDTYGNTGNPDIAEGRFSFTDTRGLFTINDTWCTLDIGAYHRPGETYYVADMHKAYTDSVCMGQERWVEPGREFLSTSGYSSSTPKYWTVPNPTATNGRIEPMDGQYGVIQAEVNDFFDTFDLTTTLGMQGNYDGTLPATYRTLSTLNINGVHMPPLTLGGNAMPGAKLVLYPDSNASINMELRTRLKIDEVTFSNPLNSGPPDLKISGIYLGETFYNQWNTNPLHTEGNVSGSIAGWSTNFQSFMYSGYFLLGNLNEVDFADYLKLDVGDASGATMKDGRQIYELTTNTYGDPDENPHHDTESQQHIPLWIRPNPLSINIGKRGPNVPNDPDNFNLWDNRSYLSVSGGIHGSIRVASVQGHGTEMGPIALDGLRIKHLEIEFPGGRTRLHFEYQWNGSDFVRNDLGTAARGLIWEGQYDYLNNLTLGSWQP